MTKNQSEEIGFFGYDVHVFRRPDGSIDYQPTHIVKNVLIEIMIMQMHVFLETLKKDYADQYGKTSASL